MQMQARGSLIVTVLGQNRRHGIAGCIGLNTICIPPQWSKYSNAQRGLRFSMMEIEDKRNRLEPQWR
jgi:hypothetical protein